MNAMKSVMFVENDAFGKFRCASGVDNSYFERENWHAAKGINRSDMLGSNKSKFLEHIWGEIHGTDNLV